jgi:NADH-quinone oxidoreductase subunit H
MRSLLFFLAEWGNLYLIGAIVTTLYMGGWRVPAFTTNTTLFAVAQFATFFLKAYFFVFVAMWIRATLPRVRVDQLMSLCWKYMVPIALGCVLGTATLMVVVPSGTEGARVLRYATFALVVWVVLLFGRRVRFHLRRARGLQPGIAA